MTTDLDRDYATVSFTVLSGSLSPSELQAAIGLEPDESWEQGSAGKADRVHRYNGASYTSRGPDEAPLEEHLRELVGRLKSVAENIAHLGQTPHVRSRQLRLFLQTSDNPSIGLSPDDLVVLAELGTDVILNVDFVCDDRDSA